MKYPVFIISFLATILLSCKTTDESEPIPSTIDQNTSEQEIVDLSHTYSRETVYWVTAKEFKKDTVAFGDTDNGFFYSAFNFETAEHGGTHIDAPIHFAKGRQTVDQIPLTKLVGPAIKINLTDAVGENQDYLISIEDLRSWESDNGYEIPDKSIVLLETGHSKYYPDRQKYLGTENRGMSAIAELHFPGLSPEAAQWLVDNRNIHAIGLDTPSIDFGQSTTFDSHVILLNKNIPVFENLTNLDKLPIANFTVVALPMKIQGGSGAPLRIIALIDSDTQ